MPLWSRLGAVCRREASAERWKRPKKYLWLLAAAVPALIFPCWLAAQRTGFGVFWWGVPILAFVIIPVLDHLMGPDVTDSPDESVLAWLETNRFYRWATYLYLPNQYLSLVFACWLWSGGGWVSMALADKVGLMAAVGLVGGLAINAAHELGHTRIQAERRLSKVALAQTCYGHFYVEHNRGHHVRVATPEDPASARLGEHLYAFIPRSVLGGLRSAWRLEADRLAGMGKSRWSLSNDVLNAWPMTAALFTVLSVWFGPVVLPWLIGQAIIGFCLLETVNYMEHYGLRRQKLPSGRYERVRPAHSWNSSSVITNVLLFHLQRHSDHHANPLRPYQVLRHVDEAPQLPSGYSAMLLVALLPPLWRRVMDPRVLDFYGGDVRLAALKPGADRPRPALRFQAWPRSLRVSMSR
ncbi:alkane 1-monooxygenase [Mycobacterium paraense]|uniref:Alkane 1-monooxygenase n=1 Tax=Mycobacterium paraense TaxID=767916 RepID=A0ABX3VKA1_9MYCO|nr:alkane 1-monooxygenase [Mycobacterium paraense]ORW29547.1 alkane 1-monooxygenase [Mycobacterium paraense]ORW37670.1 alkane 1-monooxygenase [Mycobacterium paraense]